MDLKKLKQIFFIQNCYVSYNNIPVLSLPNLKPAFSRVIASPIAGSSSMRPAGLLSRPILILPRKNVPVVIITALALITSPSPKNTCL